jgi:hypothetical protein
MKTRKYLIVSVIAILVIAGVVLATWTSKENVPDTTVPLTKEHTLQTYENREFGFAFKHPTTIPIGNIDTLLTEEEKSKYQTLPIWIFRMTLAPGVEPGATLFITTTEKEYIEDVSDAELQTLTDTAPFTKTVTHRELGTVGGKPAILLTLVDQETSTSSSQTYKQCIVLHERKFYVFYGTREIYEAIVGTFAFKS